jgi:hypothetical protein
LQSHLYLVIKAHKKTMHILPDICSISRSTCEEGVFVQNTDKENAFKEGICVQIKEQKDMAWKEGNCVQQNTEQDKKNLCVQNKEQTYA